MSIVQWKELHLNTLGAQAVANPLLNSKQNPLGKVWLTNGVQRERTPTKIATHKEEIKSTEGRLIFPELDSTRVNSCISFL